jgi:hypothetical protein
MNYYVFFTTQYTDSCLQNCRFGATSVNSLANVKNKDIAFIFDGLRWKVYGPLRIISDQQYYDNSPIYGKNKRGVVNYPNRVSFNVSKVRELSVNGLFAQETDYKSESYLLNRTLLSIIIANKQVHSTPLTNAEGIYLEKAILTLGNSISLTNQDLKNVQPIIDYVISNRKPKSESIFELLLLENKHNHFIGELEKPQNKLFNQFVLGIQRQIDILSISDSTITIMELKTKENHSSPYEQLREYKDYALSDYRIKEFGEKDIKLIAILEEGNQYLINSIPASYPDIFTFSFNMTREYVLEIKNA